MRLTSLLVVHEETDDCENHCQFHGVDEPGPAYLWCIECGHGYRSAKELMRAYRKGGWQLIFSRPFRWVGRKGFEPSTIGAVISLLTTRVDDIRFCPLCIHDF